MGVFISTLLVYITYVVRLLLFIFSIQIEYKTKNCSVPLQVLHAASLAYFVNASLCGVYFHWLLLSTGNIVVPIVTHAVYDAFALVFCHLKARNSGRAPVPYSSPTNYLLFCLKNWYASLVDVTFKQKSFS